MKASSSDASTDDDAENFELDYCDFFSVLMYYGHMSKDEIMSSSRPFLYGVYKQYAKRACENLGVSPDGEEDGADNTALKESDYPIEFKKLDKCERRKGLKEFSSTEDFMKQFSGFNRDKYTFINQPQIKEF